jgi:hypothetical protein
MVEARSCGDCTVCCIVPGIDTPQIQKITGAACRNCVEGGCAIYEARPRACREFFCAWIEGAMGEGWRPDQCGVLSQPVTLDGRQGMSLMLIADAVKTVRQAWFVDYVQAGVQGGVPLVLALPGPHGTRSAKLLLNTPQMARAAAGTAEQVRQQLRQAVKTLAASAFAPLPLLNTGNDVSK